MENFQDLIKLITARKKVGWETLYNQYGSKFYDYSIQRWNLNEDEAWDVVYQTLETVVNKISRYNFKSQEDFDKFIYRVLINFLKKKFRSKRFQEGRQTVYVDFNGEQIRKSENSIISSIEVQEYYANEASENQTLVQLKSILENFEPLERDLLLLRAQNYSYEEIGEMLQIDNVHLKVKHHRVKKADRSRNADLEIIKPWKRKRFSGRIAKDILPRGK